MASPFDARRYLTRFDTRRVPNIMTDVLVIGSGIAGLRVALGCAEFADVILVTKADATESNTQYAQGGIAAVLRPPDSIQSHKQDTLNVGCGLCAAKAVDLLVREGPTEVQRLLDLGMQVDRDGDEIAFRYSEVDVGLYEPKQRTY